MRRILPSWSTEKGGGELLLFAVSSKRAEVPLSLPSSSITEIWYISECISVDSGIEIETLVSTASGQNSFSSRRVMMTFAREL